MEKTKIPRIGILAMLLLTFGFYSSTTQYANAITFTDIELTQAPALGDTFTDGTRKEIWLGADTHVKVINQVTNTVVSTIAISGGGVTDVKCGATHCYAFQSTTTPFRLWKISATTVGGLYNIVGSVNGTSGAEGGRVLEVIDVVTDGVGAVNIFLPIMTTDCDGLGGGDEVLAILDGNLINTTNTFSTVCSTVIALGDFISGIAHSGKFQQVIGDERNSIMVKFLNAVTNNVKIFDLATLGTICQVTFGAGSLENHIYVKDDYWFVGNVATDNLGLFATPETSGADCVQDDTVSAPTNYELRAGIDIDTAHGYLFLPTMATAGTDSYISVRNLTVSQNDVELFRLVMEDGTIRHNFYYAPQDELFATNLAEATVRVFSLGDPEDEDTGGGNQVGGVCGVGTVLDCIGDRSTAIAITGGQDITVVSANLLCGLGLNSTCSGTTQDNGTGIILMLITGTFFASAILATIATANTKFGAGISYTEIPKELWLFLVVGVVAFSWYMLWIPDILFYGMIVGLAGLFSFGLYKHIRGG